MCLAPTWLALASCSSEQTATDTASQPSRSAATTEPAPNPTLTAEDTEPTSGATELETHLVGELITLPAASFTVKTLEQRDVIESSSPDFVPNFTPGEGQRLWYIEIEWTNLTNEVVDKECHGPYAFSLHIYDVDGIEMQEVDQPGFVTGNNCSTGLSNGQTGTWRTAYLGNETDFGYAEFDDLSSGDSAFVVLDPNIRLSKS